MVTPIDQLDVGLLGRQPRGLNNIGSGLLGPIPRVNISSQLMSAAQPTALGRVRGALGQSLSNPNILRGIAAGLLSGPSRTPVSFGQSLLGGLQAGQQLQEAEEDRLFKRRLLEREADLATQRVNLLGTQVDLEKQRLLGGGKGESVNVRLPSGVTTIGREDEAGNIFLKTEGGQLIPAPFGSTKVSLSVQASGLSDLTPAAQEKVKEGLDLSKDSVVLADGTVQVVPGSKTAQELKLKDLGIKIKNDNFELSKKEFETATRFKERELAIKEGKAAREDSKFRLEYDKLNFAFQQEQNIEARKKEDAFDEAFAISTTINDVFNLVEQYGEENVFGPEALFAKLPVFGPSQPQGMVAAKLETLNAQLVKRAMSKFREGNKQGATGFGALNEQELRVIQSLFTNLLQSQGGPQIMQNLRRLKTSMDALAFGVVNKGEFEDYTPTLHNEGLLDGSILPATKQNSYLIGAPSVPGYTFKGFQPSGPNAGRPVFVNNKRAASDPLKDQSVFLEGY
jgi:hypothetical protein